jgi:hypothetical protein
MPVSVRKKKREREREKLIDLGAEMAIMEWITTHPSLSWRIPMYLSIIMTRVLTHLS